MTSRGASLQPEQHGADVSADGGCVNAHVLFDNATLAPESGSAGRIFVARADVPPREEERWVAFFVAVTYHGVKEAAAEVGAPRECVLNRARVCIPITAAGDLTLTTQVAIVPDYLPFECVGSGCAGTLL